ncbi:MAG: TIGR02996 domain-containing protein [Myxococcaceae bacterium]|nr:TIGR02996 domain-containing protein [Myxococcaceae bacterium]
MFLPAQHELLLQIVEQPDDDTLRFVLADRLNELGDPLGELIHVQCAIERMLKGEGGGDWPALKRREDELVKAHGAAWQQAAAPFARGMRMKRGLPHTLRCSVNALLEDGGLTVLAPIVQLELEQVDAEQLEALLTLPLLRRIRTLVLTDVRGLGRLRRAPPPMPSNVRGLKISVEGLESLDRLVSYGLLDGIEELELGIRFFMPQPLVDLEPPAVPKLEKLSFVGLTGRYDRRLDDAWLPHLEALAAVRPGLIIGWRGLEYDASNLRTAATSLEPQFPEDPVARPAGEYNREDFGELVYGPPVRRATPKALTVMRLQSGALLAKAVMNGDASDAMQSMSLDAALQLQLAPMPGVLTARAFSQEWNEMYLRYEPYPSLTLHELALPLPMPIALAVVAKLAPAMLGLRERLRVAGVAGWPRAVTLDDVLVGTDGDVKLMPPFLHCLMEEGRSERPPSDVYLGGVLNDDLEGTDDGVLVLLGTALLHLLAGEVVSPRLRPSALNPGWRTLDRLVEGCLSPRRAARFASAEAFAVMVNHAPEKASADAVAQAVVSRQMSLP